MGRRQSIEVFCATRNKRNVFELKCFVQLKFHVSDSFRVMDTGGTFHALLIAVEMSQLDVISTCHVAISKQFPVL